MFWEKAVWIDQLANVWRALPEFIRVNRPTNPPLFCGHNNELRFPAWRQVHQVVGITTVNGSPHSVALDRGPE